ncbi:MAG: D-alanyl-D-alanine carboxypeptidase [Pseudomonadota bacterium]
MRSVFRCVSVFAFALCVWAAAAGPSSANSKYAAFVMHAESGDVLFDRYSTQRRYPASLTKMMTLYLLFEELEAGNLTLQSKLKVSKNAAGQPPSKLGVKAGSTITVESAIEALVVKSANDVAVVVAESISGSEWRFARKMTTKARKLGMKRTTFRNASGLPNSKQLTTARDLGVLARRVSQDFPQYFYYFSAKSFSWNGRTYRTHNALVRSFKGADGLKTGYTRRSGFNLATTATRDGQRLIGIVLGGRSSATRDRHMREILTKGFARLKKNPTLIAALHRKKPAPRLKPTLVARLAAEKAAPTVADNEALRREIMTAAAAMDAPASNDVVTINGVLSKEIPPQTDTIGALIASADPDDLNEVQRARIAALTPDLQGFVGEGDLEALSRAEWAVQIGAYSSKALAQKELEEAAFAGALMERKRAVIETPRDGEPTLYRARFTKMSEIEAVAACETLKDKAISCFVISDADTAAKG